MTELVARTRLSTRLRRWLRGGLPTWYDPDYRLPVSSAGVGNGMEPRRADFVAWYLADSGALRREDLRHPPRASWAWLARVHTPELLRSLSDRDTLARVMGLPSWDIPVEELLLGVRLAVGGTVEATREALRRDGPTLNLLGGYHHAAPDKAAGLCLVNDIAIALAVARQEGFDGRVVVIDLDAHPPDGTAACLASDPKAWIGSLSRSDWGSLPGVDETVLPPGTPDGPYLDALDALLGRMPDPALAFVIAGGDVLAEDQLGQLGLSEAGARARDLKVARALAGVPAVWLPGGGYSNAAWRVLAGTALAVALGTERPIPSEYAPLRRRFDRIFRNIDREALGEAPLLSGDELAEALGVPVHKTERWLGQYTASGLEYAFYEYGILDQLRRLGYRDFRVTIERERVEGEMVRLLGCAEGQEHVLIECVASRESLHGRQMLYVNWLTLRHPRAGFHPARPQLPGQSVPGLGLAPEITEMLGLVARRLGLEGVWFRPAHYHVAYSGRQFFRFTDAARQGRFEALMRDLEGLSLLEATRAVDEGRVRSGGTVYDWEASDMVYDTIEKPKGWAEEVKRVREGTRFEVG
ncbi:MAG: histone deacetylase [Alphaproteobacteria bacterium]|nr:histone deacetylase [Alphaproteobacteria bacterium]